MNFELFLLSSFFGLPLLTLAHELGHATVALFVTKGPVKVCVGPPEKAFRFSVGRLRVSFAALGTGGICLSSNDGVTRKQALVRLLAGPGVSGAIACAAWVVAARNDGALQAVSLSIAAIGTLHLLSLLPRWSPHGSTRLMYPSDGLQVLCLLRKRRLPPPPERTPELSLTAPLDRWQVVSIALTLAIGGVLTLMAGTAAYLGFYIGMAAQGMLNRRVARKLTPRPAMAGSEAQR